MRAAVLNEFGPPEMLRIEEGPDPVPGPGQVVVEVSAAGITFVETQVRAGRPPNPAMAPALPAILGNGVAGVVAGRPVITTTGGLGGYGARGAGRGPPGDPPGGRLGRLRRAGRGPRRRPDPGARRRRAGGGPRPSRRRA